MRASVLRDFQKDADSAVAALIQALEPTNSSVAASAAPLLELGTR